MTRRSRTPASVDGQLRLGAGLSPSERDAIVRQFSRLDARLRAYPADGTEIHVSVKDRDCRTQRTVLECRLPHRKLMVATSARPDLRLALREVRNELLHQLDETKTRLDRRNDRETLRTMT
jgi:ribosome-associated translation inhibitor RaiA